MPFSHFLLKRTSESLPTLPVSIAYPLQMSLPPEIAALIDDIDDSFCFTYANQNLMSQSNASGGRPPPTFGVPVRASAVSEARIQERDLQMPDQQRPQRIPEAAHVFIDPKAQDRASRGPPPPTSNTSPSFTQGSAAPGAPIREDNASENSGKRGIATRILSFLGLSWLRHGDRKQHK